MDGTSLMMMAFVWGSLLVFFLVPFEGKRRTYSDVKESFATCLKQSFVEITFHKKALFAFFLIAITVFVTSWSQSQDQLYNDLHGISPQTKSINYTLGTILYAACIYLFIIARRALKHFRSTD